MQGTDEKNNYPVLWHTLQRKEGIMGYPAAWESVWQPVNDSGAVTNPGTQTITPQHLWQGGISDPSEPCLAPDKITS